VCTPVVHILTCVFFIYLLIFFFVYWFGSTQVPGWLLHFFACFFVCFYCVPVCHLSTWLVVAYHVCVCVFSVLLCTRNVHNAIGWLLHCFWCFVLHFLCVYILYTCRIYCNKLLNNQPIFHILVHFPITCVPID
jgi:hypothetical protein